MKTMWLAGVALGASLALAGAAYWHFEYGRQWEVTSLSGSPRGTGRSVSPSVLPGNFAASALQVSPGPGAKAHT